MSGCRGKGGKVIGEGRGAGCAGAREGHEAHINWLARDIRETEQGEKGLGRRQEKSSVQQKPKKSFTCVTCQDLCCGLARELVTEAFGLGKVTMSRKVILIVILNLGLSLIFQDFDRAMAEGLRRAKALRQQGGRS